MLSSDVVSFLIGLALSYRGLLISCLGLTVLFMVLLFCTVMSCLISVLRSAVQCCAVLCHVVSCRDVVYCSAPCVLICVELCYVVL